MQFAQPQAEHQWLHQLIGEWTYEAECSPGPDQPPMKSGGSEVVRSLGGLWILCEGQGGMPDGEIGKMIITLGFDPAKRRFVGSFVGSMMTNMWVYEGKLNGNVLTLDTVGPSFTDETKTAKYQDIIEIKGANERTLSSQFQGDDGQWHKFMTSTYKRK